jgi:hypothetical protein
MKAFWPKHRLGREIAVLLTVKLVVLTAIFFAFFSPAHRLHPDSTTVSDHLLSQTDR